MKPIVVVTIKVYPKHLTLAIERAKPLYFFDWQDLFDFNLIDPTDKVFVVDYTRY